MINCYAETGRTNAFLLMNNSFSNKSEFNRFFFADIISVAVLKKRSSCPEGAGIPNRLLWWREIWNGGYLGSKNELGGRLGLRFPLLVVLSNIYQIPPEFYSHWSMFELAGQNQNAWLSSEEKPQSSHFSFLLIYIINFEVYINYNEINSVSQN